MLFYDAEVTKFDWMFCIKDTETRTTHKIINDRDKLIELYEKHKNDIWVGFNSRFYDVYIVKSIICGFNPYDVSQYIIEKDMGGWSYSDKFQQIQLFNFDLMTTMHGLKQLEAFMGSSIQETSIPFDIDRKLTPEELEEMFEYCNHDVNQTMWVFQGRKDDFTSQIDLIKEFNLPAKHFSKTKAQLSAMILGAIKSYRSDEFDISIPTTLRVEKYKHIVDWYKNKDNMDYEKKLIIDVAGVPHVFAWGGIHGAIPNYKGEGIYVNMDVKSYYPALMIEYNYLSRNVLSSEKYRRIRDMRLDLKSKDDPREKPYKIVLNATYGAMKDKYNNLYDPLMANNVCVAGQLLLLDLIEHLEPHCQVIQSNTDGVMVKIEKMEDFEVIKSVAAEWEKRVHMELEFEFFSKVYQGDVNNYIFVPEGELYDKKGKPRWKTKGAYVKKLSNLDNDLPIVNKAIVDYFVKGIPIETTINESNSLVDFQKVVKVSRKYQYALHGENKVQEKVLRVFASNREEDGGITKVHVNGKPAKVGNTPEKCFIDNSDIKEKGIPEYLDRNWYIETAKSRAKKFNGGKVIANV